MLRPKRYPGFLLRRLHARDRSIKRLALDLAEWQLADRALRTAYLHRTIGKSVMAGLADGEHRKSLIGDGKGKNSVGVVAKHFQVSTRTVETALKSYRLFLKRNRRLVLKHWRHDYRAQISIGSPGRKRT